jgi:hypothetical protein
MAAITPAMPLPPWTPDTFASQPASYQLYQDTLCYTPAAILPKANQQWLTASPNTHYSTTYHTHFPSQWAMQALTLNILMIALITHLQYNIPKQLNDALQ